MKRLPTARCIPIEEGLCDVPNELTPYLALIAIIAVLLGNGDSLSLVRDCEGVTGLYVPMSRHC